MGKRSHVASDQGDPPFGPVRVVEAMERQFHILE